MSTLVISVFRCKFSKPCYLRFANYSSQPKQANKNNAAKVVNVAIIGAPNSGKSTLINKIVDRKICAASNKVHTTTKMIRAMYFQNDTQIIFLDTPGVVTEREQKKYKLPESMIGSCYKGLRCADVVGVVHDISNRFTKDSLHHDVVSMLESVKDTPSFLIINKVDLLKSKTQLLTCIRNLTNGFIAGNPVPGQDRDKRILDRGYSKFSDVFLVSALKGDGITDIREYLLSNAKPANLHYTPNEWTDQKPETLIIEAVRAKFLDFLSNEIPYNIKVELEYYEDNVEENKIICFVSAECPTERLVKLVSGAGGGRLQQIKSHVRADLTELFKKLVVIDIKLKSKIRTE
ncbi:GTPase Era, mitochondrial [Ostrinia furnacalis]|uniref:GTPase Era, mitochondrial n=1 Tax=Ostrinia furnacalis TaxID=93504 RepID=UPI00103A324A|nr:GTPase Era, mitochondrial [Ostrinia furnacalis]